MMKRRSAFAVCILVLVASFVLLLAGAVGAPAGARGPAVVVGTANDLYAPFEYPIAGGAKSIGFDNDLVTAIAKRAGFVVVQRTFAFPYIGGPPGPWADCDMVAAALSPFPHGGSTRSSRTSTSTRRRTGSSSSASPRRTQARRCARR